MRDINVYLKKTWMNFDVINTKNINILMSKFESQIKQRILKEETEKSFVS